MKKSKPVGKVGGYQGKSGGNAKSAKEDTTGIGFKRGGHRKGGTR